MESERETETNSTSKMTSEVKANISPPTALDPNLYNKDYAKKEQFCLYDKVT